MEGMALTTFIVEFRFTVSEQEYTYVPVHALKRDKYECRIDLSSESAPEISFSVLWSLNPSLVGFKTHNP